MLTSPPASDSAQRILKAAQHITFSRGVSALRMAGLAYELAMSKKTLYAYYANKEALLAAMMDAHFQHCNDLLEAVLRHPTMPFLERLQQINGEMSAEVTQDFRRHAPDLLAGFEQRKAAAVQQYFRELLAEGLHQGMLRADLALDIVADILMDAITYRLTTSNLQAKAYSVPEAFTAFYQLLFAGLLSDKARKQYLRTNPLNPA